MKLQELKDKVLSIEKVGYGHWRVNIKYRNKTYSCTTTNSMAVDGVCYDEWNPANKCVYVYYELTKK